MGQTVSGGKARWKLHLEPFFGALRAVELTSQLVAQCIDARQQERAENATVNRELAALKRMFHLARQSTPPKVSIVPYSQCFARTTFEPGTTKNDQGREVSMTLPVNSLLMQCVHGKTSDDYVFTREDAKPVRDFRGTWANACEAAKVPSLLFHDLRRTAARNLRRAGVAEGVVMKICGWKTRSVFDRYAIVSQSDIRDAMVKLEAGQKRDNAKAAHEQKRTEEQFGQDLGRIAPKKANFDTTLSAGTLPVN